MSYNKIRVCVFCKEEAHDPRLKICMSCGSDLPKDEIDHFDRFIKEKGL